MTKQRTQMATANGLLSIVKARRGNPGPKDTNMNQGSRGRKAIKEMLALEATQANAEKPVLTDRVVFWTAG